jgi:hypothetical protein
MPDQRNMLRINYVFLLLRIQSIDMFLDNTIDDDFPSPPSPSETVLQLIILSDPSEIKIWKLSLLCFGRLISGVTLESVITFSSHFLFNFSYSSFLCVLNLNHLLKVNNYTMSNLHLLIFFFSFVYELPFVQIQ